MSNRLSRRNFIRMGLVGMTGSKFYKNSPKAFQGQESLKIKEYRVLGRTGMRVSDVSLGAGVPQDPALVSYVIDKGVNYLDTAEGYSRGQSEKVIGQAIKGRRKEVFITTKLGVRKNHTEKQLLDRFRNCLERLQTDYVDVLMFHNPKDTETLTLPAFHKTFQKLKADGKVRFSGLSCHEPAMAEICNFAINDGRFDVLLLVYNFMQEKAAEILKYASQKQVGITIMKVHAGEHPEQLRSIPPEEQQRLQDEADRGTLQFQKKYNLSEKEYFGAAMRWVLQNKDVGCVVMSIRNFEQADDYISSSGIKFAENDRKLLAWKALDRQSVYCRHACGDCQRFCPHGVAINDVLRMDTYFTNYREEKFALMQYAELEESQKPMACTSCAGQCEKYCPFNLPVRKRLISAQNRLTLT
ncbi:aldo/keto reductase [Acidobacteriota bacterium]